MITVLACSLVPGTVDDASERIGIAMMIFGIGLFLLVLHVAVFAYRSLRKHRKSKWVFWSALILSVFVIPIAYYSVMISGTACGYGASYGPIVLLIFELTAFVVQLAHWRFRNQSAHSAVPLD